MSDERTSFTTGSFTASPGPSQFTDAIPGLVLVYSRAHQSIPSALPFDGRSLTIGREPDNTLALREAAVSRYHARIENRPQGFALVDTGSTNGTLVNGLRVTEHLLVDQDVVRIGDSVFRFAESMAHRYAAYRITGEKELSLCPPHGIVGPLLIGGMQIDLVLEHIAKLARTTISILVSGESGTGKELVARELHRWSGRRGAFMAINCASIPANLLESELFGFKRGAFTGATQDKMGLVQAANGGTVFLDEVGDMPLEAQAKLLRVLQEREVVPLGSTQPVKVDVRFLSATHRNLDRLVAEGRFRGDLLARLREAEVRLPALRDRREDLLLLVNHFLRKAGAFDAVVDLGTMLALAHYDFPYNVRELESAIRVALAMAQGAPIEVRHLPTIIQQALEARNDSQADVTERSSMPTEAELRSWLKKHQGNVTAVGREYGKERMQIHRWMKRYGIDPETYRRG